MFFKKIQKEATPKIEEPAVNKEEIIQKAEELINDLNTKQGEERIQTLDQIGIYYVEAGELDLAIQYLETSLNEKKAVGKGYTTLLKVYNMKRKESAGLKDDEKLQYYLTKIDEMMKISKEVIRSNL